MVEMSRKGFFRLVAAGAAGLATSERVPAQARNPDTVQKAGKTLIRGADILTMDAQLGELKGVDVLLSDGKIAAIGKSLSVDDAEIVNAEGMILMPGMVDGHRHIWTDFDAGRLVKTDPKRYAKYQQWKMAVMVCMTPEDFYLAEYIGGLKAVDAGVTSVLDYAHAHHTTDKAIAGARGFIDSGLSGVFCYQISHNPTYGPGAVLPLAQANAERDAPPQDGNYQTAFHLRDRLFSDRDSLVQFGLATSEAIGRRPVDQFKQEMKRARELEPLIITTHVHRPNPMPPNGIVRSIADMHAVDLLGPDFHVSHGVQMTDEELIMLRDTGGMVCSTVTGEFPYPEPSIHAKARHLGVAAGIGTDLGLAFTTDYFEHVRASFWSLYRSSSYAALAASYSPWDVLDFATGLGARALRRGDSTGTISIGKNADLVMLRTDRIGFAGIGSLASRVLNFASQSDIDSVWIRGVARKRNGDMIGVSWPALRGKLDELQTRVARDAATITFT